MGAPGRALVFAALVGVAALAALDDAFWHVEPGTSAADHLVPGFVPLGVAVLLAVAAPRLPAVVFGWLAIGVGAIAGAAGVADGVRHVAVDRLAGDDVTALLAAAAGAGLVVLGGATLWRERHTGGTVMRRVARRAATGLLVAVLAVFVVVPVVFAVVATHKARSPAGAVDLGRRAQTVTLTTSDGLRLAASYVPSRNGAAVLVFPGRRQTAPHARLLIRHGYGVLVLDRRGEGESEGTYNAFGWDGVRDVRAAVAWLAARPGVRRVGGVGLSVGGELLLEAAASDRRLHAVVSEGAGVRSVREHLHTPGLGRVQRWLSPDVATTAAVAVLSGTAAPVDLADASARLRGRPVLLIRAADGNHDELLNDVYRTRSGAALWELPAGGHVGALDAGARAYERRVVGFLDRALLSAAPAG